MAKNTEKRHNVTFSHLSIISWLGVRDSNPRMPGPKPGALPLGQPPINGSMYYNFLKVSRLSGALSPPATPELRDWQTSCHRKVPLRHAPGMSHTWPTPNISMTGTI